jgi:drug/metabolite transporter (DMT)-like permease
MRRFLLPIIFVVLWSSAFVAGKAGLQHATPFAFLALRFSLVTLLFVCVSLCILVWRNVCGFAKNGTSNAPLKKYSYPLTVLVGVLVHGAYLGSTFFAMANGLGAALAALIVSTQPLLTTLMATFVFCERPKKFQWVGIFIGFLGVVVVLLPSIGGSAPLTAIIACIVGLLAITAGTLVQKHVGLSINLLKSNIIQAAAASLFFISLVFTVENPEINWNETFLIALAWQIIAVSAGAYLILMILIKRDSVAETTSLLFLVPPVTAIIAFFVLGEPLATTTLFGFLMASFGTYLVTHRSKQPKTT